MKKRREDGQHMNRTAMTALCALMMPLFFLTACVSAEVTPPKEVPAAKETSEKASPGSVPANKDSSGTGDNRRTDKNVKTDENKKEEDKAEQPFPADLMEREEDPQEQVWESEDSAEDDHEEREDEHTADKGSGAPPAEEAGESPHIHDWVEQTETVHHEETGHYEEVITGTRTVVDEEAYDEPVYQTKCVCSACGYEADSVDEISGHLESHYDPELGYIDASYSVQEIVTDIIHHEEVSHEEPVYEEKWIVDSEAWDETVVTGCRCRTCGAVK